MADLLISGLELMLLGMGIVFVFLTTLVFTLHGMTKLAERFHQTESQVQNPAKSVTDVGAAGSTHLAVISAAIMRYRTART